MTERGVETMNEQRCVICGTPFNGSKNKKYCSHECVLMARRGTHKRQLKERGRRNIGDIIICPTCGKNFPYNSGNRKYCSLECKNKAQQIKADESASPRQRKKRAKTIVDIIRAAKAEGLSYGEYVSKYGV